MKKYIKPIIAVSIVFIGSVFLKIGSNDSLWLILISLLGAIVVLVPAYLWYNDKLNF